MNGQLVAFLPPKRFRQIDPAEALFLRRHLTRTNVGPIGRRGGRNSGWIGQVLAAIGGEIRVLLADGSIVSASPSDVTIIADDDDDDDDDEDDDVDEETSNESEVTVDSQENELSDWNEQGETNNGFFQMIDQLQESNPILQAVASAARRLLRLRDPSSIEDVNDNSSDEEEGVDVATQVKIYLIEWSTEGKEKGEGESAV